MRSWSPRSSATTSGLAKTGSDAAPENSRRESSTLLGWTIGRSRSMFLSAPRLRVNSDHQIAELGTLLRRAVRGELLGVGGDRRRQHWRNGQQSLDPFGDALHAALQRRDVHRPQGDRRVGPGTRRGAPSLQRSPRPSGRSGDPPGRRPESHRTGGRARPRSSRAGPGGFGLHCRRPRPSFPTPYGSSSAPGTALVPRSQKKPAIPAPANSRNPSRMPTPCTARRSRRPSKAAAIAPMPVTITGLRASSRFSRPLRGSRAGRPRGLHASRRALARSERTPP